MISENAIVNGNERTSGPAGASQQHGQRVAGKLWERLPMNARGLLAPSLSPTSMRRRGGWKAVRPRAGTPPLLQVRLMGQSPTKSWLVLPSPTKSCQNGKNLFYEKPGPAQGHVGLISPGQTHLNFAAQGFLNRRAQRAQRTERKISVNSVLFSCSDKLFC